MKTVLIVGAGPTGLTLAISLLQRGITPRIIDQKSGPSTHTKALGIHARTLEVFDKLECVDDFLAAGIKADTIEIHCGNKISSLHIDSIDSPYPYVLILPQSETEKILLKKLEELGGVVEWNTPLEQESTDGYAWVIGCDGAHSHVRHLMNLEFTGSAFSESFFLADVELKTPRDFKGPHFYLQRKGLVAAVPLPQNGLRIIIPLRPKDRIQSLEALLEEKGCLELADIQVVKWSSLFHIHRRIVSHFRRSNFFLVGDAAHIHSPVGGQGMNTSVQDAHNLGWKLALEIQNVASKWLLDSYEKERRPIAKKVLAGTTFATNIVTFFSRTGLTPLFNILLFFIRPRPVRKFLAKNLSEVSLHYDRSPINYNGGVKKGPKVGYRALDVILKNEKRLFDYLRTTKFVILLFQKNEFLMQNLTHYEKWVEKVYLNDPHLCKTYGDAIYIIRPDGVIGFKGRKNEEVIEYLLKNFKRLF